MGGYYLRLAVRCLRRNVALTVLIIAAVGVGIGASMTVFSVLLAMSGDPIPQKSTQLFAPQIDVWGPVSRTPTSAETRLPDQLTYRDAAALMWARAAKRQAAMYSITQIVIPEQGDSFSQDGRATYRDFFDMFQVPFQVGAPWSTQDEANRARVVVLGANLAARLFPAGDALGRTVSFEGQRYRVVGVLKPWSPLPHFYDISGQPFASGEQFFLPFLTAIAEQIGSAGSRSCRARPADGWEGTLNSSCVWVQFWVELPDAKAARAFGQVLRNYAADQQRIGRFAWPPLIRLSNVRQWLQFEHVVPDEVHVNSLLAAGFLVVCLINAVGMMLARFAARGGDFAVRRALGASRLDIFLQCLTETAIVGALGGGLGLVLTALGLAAQRASLKSVSEYAGRLTHLDTQTMLLTVVLAVAATLLSGLYPTWRATRVQPAWQLKEQ